MANFGQIRAIFVNVLPVFDQLALYLPLYIDAFVAGLRQAVDGIHHEMEAIEIVQDRHVKWRGDGALFLVTADVDVVMICAPVG